MLKKTKNSNSTCLLVFFQIVKATLSQCLLVLTCEYSCCSPYKKHLEILLTKNYAFNFFLKRYFNRSLCTFGQIKEIWMFFSVAIYASKTQMANSRLVAQTPITVNQEKPAQMIIHLTWDRSTLGSGVSSSESNRLFPHNFVGD